MKLPACSAAGPGFQEYAAKHKDLKIVIVNELFLFESNQSYKKVKIKVAT